uniref:Uncharacterized protein n=1 Tax=Arundo donax TaxID=35708 RepID=A0A0A9ETG8_ARUDO
MRDDSSRTTEKLKNLLYIIGVSMTCKSITVTDSGI